MPKNPVLLKLSPKECVGKAFSYHSTDGSRMHKRREVSRQPLYCSIFNIMVDFVFVLFFVKSVSKQNTENENNREKSRR
jgi:hypothetical protein